MTDGGMHYLYGSTNESSCVPDADMRDRACEPSPRAAFPGPAFDVDGVMILEESFRGDEGVSLDDLAGQYLVDAFVVWECWDRCEASSSPVLLRFEDFDLTCSAGADGALALWRGAVDVEAPMKAVREGDGREDENARTCYAWERIDDLLDVAGCCLERADRKSPGEIELKFDGARLRLEASGTSVKRLVDVSPTIEDALSQDRFVL